MLDVLQLSCFAWSRGRLSEGLCAVGGLENLSAVGECVQVGRRAESVRT